MPTVMFFRACCRTVENLRYERDSFMTLYDNVQRDGSSKLIQLAKVLCRLVQTFGIILRAKYGDNVAIMALLTAIEGLCPLIGDAEQAFMDFGGENAPIEDAPSSAAGIDASAAAAPVPDPDIFS